jgi:ABC-type sugar transport system ATPase subunit
MSGLQLKNIVKRFDEVTVVKKLDLDIKEGEFMVLLGESGCGKSTTLRMIAGLEEVTEGHVFIDGVDVTQFHPMDRDIAMVFQNYALYPHMNVAQNMSFALRIAGRPAQEVSTKVNAAAKILGIEHLLLRKPKDLSGGQRQRVAIGRAIVREPKVFLFDEPLSNLDAKLRSHMRAELAILHERLGKTTVYVTHDQVEAMTLASRIAIFDKGEIQQVGTPTEVFNRPANLFVAGFIGTPSMNFFDVTYSKENGEDRLVSNGLNWRAPAWMAQTHVASGVPLVVGLRPQSFQQGAAHPNQCVIHVDVVEFLGTESQAAGTLPSQGDKRCVATLPGDAKGLMKQTVSLCFDAEAMHVFDRSTGLSMRPTPAH